RRVIPQKVHLRFGQAIGIRQHLGRDLEECLGETKLVGDQRMPAGRLPRQEITEKLGALFRRAGKRFGERYRIVVGCAGTGRFRIGHSKAFDIRSMLAWARVGYSGSHKTDVAVISDKSRKPLRMPEMVEVGDRLAHREKALLQIELATEEHGNEFGCRAWLVRRRDQLGQPSVM